MKKLLFLLLLVPAMAAAQRQTYPLDAGWRFSFRHEGSADQAREVTIPHTWNADALAGNPAYLRTVGDYERMLTIPRAWAGRRIFLRFEGVETTAELFVNGRYAGAHRGAGVAFAVEITRFVKPGAENQLRVVVSNAPVSDLFPLSTLHNIYGGITRSVSLLVTDPTLISPLYLGTSGVLVRQRSASAQRVEAEAQVYLSSTSETSARLVFELFDPAGKRVVQLSGRYRIEERPVQLSFALENPSLWSPSTPNLYTVRVRVENDSARDEVSFATGFRGIELTNKALLINGSPQKVHGFTLFYDRAGGLADEVADFELLRDAGANALRSPAGPHAQSLYDLADRTGMLVRIDLPLLRAPFLSDVSYIPSAALETNGIRQMQEIVAQNLHHPSVVMWGLFNCLWQRGDDPAPYLRRLQQAVRDMDSSRPTVADSDQDGALNHISDAVSWVQTLGWERGQTSDLSLWLEQLGRGWSSLLSAVSYGAPAMPEARQTRFHEDYARQIEAADSLLWGVWIESLFDYGAARLPEGVQSTGLISIDRTRFKDIYYLYRAKWNAHARTLHIARGGQAVYSSEGEPVVLFGTDTLHGRPFGRAVYRYDSLPVSAPRMLRVRAGALSDSVLLTPDPLSTPRRRGPR